MCSRMQPLVLHVMICTTLSAYDTRGNHFQECNISVQKVTCMLTELRLIHSNKLCQNVVSDSGKRYIQQSFELTYFPDHKTHMTI